MGLFGPGGHPHHKKLSRHARHVIKGMLRRGVVPQYASVLHTQVAAIDHEVSRKDRDRRANLNLPPDTDRIPPGQRVLLGTENRVLLKRLLESGNLRETQALVRELRHKVQERIAQAARRARAIARAKERAGQAGSAARVAARKVGTWVRNSPAHARTARGWARVQRDTSPLMPGTPEQQADSLFAREYLRVTGRLNGRARIVLPQDGPQAVRKREAVPDRVSRAAR
jgi:hypothetical protein